jgi:hypothetical protein
MREPAPRKVRTSNDAVAPQDLEFVFRDTQTLENFGGVFAKLGDVRRDLVASQAGHFDGGAEHLDVVMGADGSVTDDMARGKFGVGCDFVDFAHWSAGNVVGEEQGDQFVAFVDDRPFTDEGVEFVNQFVAAPMVLVVGMRDEILPGHQARELMPVCFGEAVNPDFAVNTGIRIAGACGGMAVAEAADLEAILNQA